MPTTRLNHKFGSSAWRNTSCAFSLCFPRHPVLCMDLVIRTRARQDPERRKAIFLRRAGPAALAASLHVHVELPVGVPTGWLRHHNRFFVLPIIGAVVDEDGWGLGAARQAEGQHRDDETRVEPVTFPSHNSPVSLFLESAGAPDGAPARVKHFDYCWCAFMAASIFAFTASTGDHVHLVVAVCV
jgi:hypothetical protein